MHRRLLVVLGAVAVTALPSLAQNSKLVGTWKLNAAKSDFGQFPPPQSETDVIEVSGADFKQHVSSVTARGTAQYTRACTIDGKDTPLTPDNPNAHIGAITLSKILCAWDGSSLVITEGFQMQGSDGTDKLTYSVSSDGSTLTLTSQITSAAMNMNRKMVYDRQAASAGDPAAMAAPVAAGSHPNLSGTWKLNTAKSDFGQMGGPDGGTETIVENDPSIKITVDQKGGMMGDVNYTETLRTDGQESSWSGMGGADVKGSGHWDASAFVITAKTSFQGSDVTIKDTMTLSSDGKTLTEASHVETGMGNFDSKAVYDKQ